MLIGLCQSCDSILLGSDWETHGRESSYGQVGVRSRAVGGVGGVFWYLKIDTEGKKRMGEWVGDGWIDGDMIKQVFS